jgi:hypothetical protein
MVSVFLYFASMEYRVSERLHLSKRPYAYPRKLWPSRGTFSAHDHIIYFIVFNRFVNIVKQITVQTMRHSNFIQMMLLRYGAKFWISSLNISNCDNSTDS